jgi:hypothetical protein
MNTAAATQQPAIALAPVESAQIHAIGHDPDTNTLAICFKRGSGAARGPGSVYHYSNFTADEFAAFKQAESLGKHFKAWIKPFADKYPYHRVAEQQEAA